MLGNRKKPSPVYLRNKILLLAVLVVGGFGSLNAANQVRVAAFRSDATPALGEPLIWVTPAEERMDPLWAKGLIIDDGKNRYVLCALDWCGVGSSIYDLFRKKIAAAAAIDIHHVALQSVHQHTAPYQDGAGRSLLAASHPEVLTISERFLQQVTDRLAESIKKAMAGLQPVDRIGVGQAVVREVASARRLQYQGKHLTRYSTSGKDALMAELPEGDIDPYLKTVSFTRGDRVIARLHYYATHPQTFCCDGRISGDFVNAAREEVEQKEAIAQIYFTGCAGDVTVGKYNNGLEPARRRLKGNLQEAMEASIRATHFEPMPGIGWKTAEVNFPKRDASFMEKYRLTWKDASKASGNDLCRAAIAIASADRSTPLELSVLRLGNIYLLHLPGEPMLAFQRYAQGLQPKAFVAVAGYGDVSTGYLCTDAAFLEGGYEPGASNVGPGTEKILKQAIDKLLGP